MSTKAGQLHGVFYNDTAEDGFNGQEGHVFAEVKLARLVDERLRIVYCLYRSNVADFSDAVALLQVGDEDCVDSGIQAAFDTPYPTALALDRDADTLTFAAGDSEFVHTVATPIFSVEEGSQFIRTRARAWNGSTTIGYVDGYRTSSDAPLVSTGAAPVEPVTGTEDSTGTTETDSPVTDAGTDAGTDGAADTSSGGGGCSIAGRGGDGLTWLLTALAGAGLLLRRCRRSAA